ncbi:MAG: hypothetical protein AB7V18_16195 [Pyrinomonadaceae bacterium]
MRTIKVKDMGFGASFGTPGYDLETTFTTLSKNDFSLAFRTPSRSRTGTTERSR